MFRQTDMRRHMAQHQQNSIRGEETHAITFLGTQHRSPYCLSSLPRASCRYPVPRGLSAQIVSEIFQARRAAGPYIQAFLVLLEKICTFILSVATQVLCSQLD